MKIFLPIILLFFAVSCDIIPGNATDPDNPDYVKPYLTVNSTDVHDGDTIAADFISLTVTGNTPDKNQYRYRVDSMAWSAWKPMQGECKIRNSLSEADAGRRTLTIETCYHPNGEIIRTTISFVKVNIPRIIAMSDTAIHTASGQPLNLWINATGTTPVSSQWFCNGAMKNGATRDTLSFDSVRLADQGSYFCIASNRWGADTSDTIRLSVSKTNYAPKWKTDTLRFIVSEGQTLTRNLVDSCTGRNGDPLHFRMLHDLLDNDSLTPEGIYTFIAGPDDSGIYKVTAVADDGGLADTAVLSVTVRHVNRIPVFLASLPETAYQIKQGDLLTIRFKAADADGDKLTYSVKQTNLPRITEIVIDDSSLTWQSAVNDGNAYTIKLAASDGRDTGFVDIDIAVGNVNLPPRITIASITDGQTVSVKEQDTLRFTVQVSDPNNGDTPVLFAIRNAPYANAANGFGSYDTVNGKFIYVPTYRVSTRQQQKIFKDVFFTASDKKGGLDTFSITIAVTDSNRPPAVVLLEPADNAQAVAKSTVFKWRVSDPDGDSVVSTVGIGTATAQLDIAQQSHDTTGHFTTLLQNGRLYFWQVTVTDGAAQAASTVRKFTVNSPPQLTLRQPADDATGIGLPVVFSWEGTDADPDDQSKLTYDFYFAHQDSALVRICRDTAATRKTMTSLDYNSTYQWKVVAKDGKDSAASDIFTFSTFVPTTKLSLLQLLNVTLAPAFQPNVEAYAASLPYELDSITIIPVAADSLSTIKTGSNVVKSGSSITVKGLPVGLDTIAIEVTARDRIAIDTYTVVVSRTKPNTFQRYFGQTEDDAARAAVQTADSGYLVGGSIGTTTTTGFTRLVKTNSSGELSWSKQYGNTSGVSNAYAIVQATNGHYVVLSQSLDTVANKAHIWLFECDAAGNILWEKTFSCSGYQYEYDRALAKTADGGYIIAARALSASRTDAKIWLIKTSSAGIWQWDSTYGGPSYDDVGAIAPLPDGSCIVGGRLREAGNGNDSTWIFKIDGSGNRVWSKTYPELYKAGIKSMAVANDGSIYTCGSILNENYNTNAFIAKISPSGTIIKITKLEGTEGDRNTAAIKPTSDGNLILSGWTGLNGNWDGWLLKVNQDCDTLWTRKFGSPGMDHFNNVELTKDGGYLLTGYLYNSGMWVVKTDRDGLLW